MILWHHEKVIQCIKWRNFVLLAEMFKREAVSVTNAFCYKNTFITSGNYLNCRIQKRKEKSFYFFITKMHDCGRLQKLLFNKRFV